MEKLDMIINPVIRAAAFAANEAEASRLCLETQGAWDAGQSFAHSPIVPLFGTTARESDSEEEIDAAVQQLETQLAMLAIRHTVGAMSREECTAAVRFLDRIDLGARITAFGQELQSADLRSIWNHQHPNEQPILPSVDLAPEI